MTDRTYIIGFIGALAAHVVVLVATRLLLDRSDDAVWRFLAALAPMFTAALIVLIGVTQFRRQADELDRRIMTEALLVSFWGTLIVTQVYAFLQRAGLPDLNWVWVGALMVILWGAGMAVATRRYR